MTKKMKPLPPIPEHFNKRPHQRIYNKPQTRALLVPSPTLAQREGLSAIVEQIDAELAAGLHEEDNQALARIEEGLCYLRAFCQSMERRR